MSKVGRPTLYCKEISDEICVRVAAGASIREICSDEHMPSYVSVYSWFLDADKAEFLNAYSLALKVHLMGEADELKAIADNVIAVPGEVQKAALQIKTRMWRLSKLDSKKYGDHIEPPEADNSGLDLSLLTNDQFAAYKAAHAAAKAAIEAAKNNNG